MTGGGPQQQQRRPQSGWQKPPGSWSSAAVTGNASNNNINFGGQKGGTGPAASRPSSSRPPVDNINNHSGGGGNKGESLASSSVPLKPSALAGGTTGGQAPGKMSWNQVAAALPSQPAATAAAVKQTIPPQATANGAAERAKPAASGIGGMHERLLYLLANLVGMSVQVQVKGGFCYQGIFHGAQTDSELGVILRMAFKLPRTTKPTAAVEKYRAGTDYGNVLPYIIIQPGDILQLSVIDVDLSFGDGGVLTDNNQGFQTDAAISKSAAAGKERQLERWVPENDELTGGSSALNDWGISGGSKWDQFATNERLFGVKTDFKEELYTTKLDKSSTEYLRREKEAERLAREIEKASTSNIHMAEERGQLVDDEKELDEEDRYGAVVRSAGSYIPPSARHSSVINNKSVTAATSGKPLEATLKPVEPVKPSTSPSPAAQTPSTPALDRRKSLLNPNAASFSFNIGASSFEPAAAEAQAEAISAAAMPFVPQLPNGSGKSSGGNNNNNNNNNNFNGDPAGSFVKADLKILLAPDVIFGRQIRKMDMPIRKHFAKNFSRLSNTAISRFNTNWPYGQLSYRQLIFTAGLDMAAVAAAIAFYPGAQMPIPYPAAGTLPYGYHQPSPYGAAFPAQGIPPAAGFYQPAPGAGGFAAPPPGQYIPGGVPPFAAMGVPPHAGGYHFQQFAPMPPPHPFSPTDSQASNNNNSRNNNSHNNNGQ